MEFDTWPALLDEVQDQHEINAAKVSDFIRFPCSNISCYNKYGFVMIKITIVSFHLPYWDG